MALPRVDVLGAPSYGPLHGMEGEVCHTPENASPSLADAVATGRWQAGAGNTSGGSYHGILGHDASRGPMSDPDAWVLAKTVPFTQIAGSITSNRDPAVWDPDRFPRLRELLSADAYRDPNAYLMALAFGGKAAWWSRKLGTRAGRAEVRGAFIAAARWTLRWEQLHGADLFLNLHRQWQLNRSDPGPLSFAGLILDEYEQLTAPAEPPAVTIEDLEQRVTRLRRRIGLKDAALTAAIASSSNLVDRNRGLHADLVAAREL